MPLSAPSHRPPGPAVAGACEASTCLLQLANKTLPLFASIAKGDRKLRHTVAHSLPSLMSGAVCFAACVSHMEAFLFA